MKPIGRVWIRNGSLSGYVIIGEGLCLKFGGSAFNGSNFLYLSKSQRGEDKEEVKEEVEITEASIV